MLVNIKPSQPDSFPLRPNPPSPKSTSELPWRQLKERSARIYRKAHLCEIYNRVHIPPIHLCVSRTDSSAHTPVGYCVFASLPPLPAR
ncbi:hypothetical protein CDAR_380061 [Caerostris darwini]|uniref:Uncharacterized protein n=1 Tax=Caerostris darwini TaxID=1538125 RepID=A0AAV4WCG1_9ARAC|nr:hypothetical protein CDAR_380061 [Caerostris darwini]